MFLLLPAFDFLCSVYLKFLLSRNSFNHFHGLHSHSPFFSRHNLRRSLGNGSSSHFDPFSLDSRVSRADNLMAFSRDLFGEEFLRASIKNRPHVTRMEKGALPDLLGEGVSADSLSATAQLRAAQDFVFLRQIAPFPVLSHISRNVRGWGGQFAHITMMAGVCPLWLCGDLHPPFPLCWSAFRSPPLVPLSTLSEAEWGAVTTFSTWPPSNMGDLCEEQTQIVVMSSFESSSDQSGDVAPSGLDSFRSMPVEEADPVPSKLQVQSAVWTKVVFWALN
ncbi:uncharacterized protein G2W53_028506 [Senna tora]|uniref:Uncharacterized protein n=1 Tax=Senna tora TaxID=362788 RepID=A0A834W9T0_9FABA|nr:uncharacterized protein G2W53_028506 [Senna tora]